MVLMSRPFPNGGKKNRLEIHSVSVTKACHRGPGVQLKARGREPRREQKSLEIILPRSPGYRRRHADVRRALRGRA